MNLRRLLLLVGAVILLIGVIALLVPVSISGPDGQKISCGNAIAADDTAASQANSNDPNQLKNLPIIDELTEDPRDYVAECNSAIGDRRMWSIPVAIIGLVVLAGSFLVGGRTSRAG
ncbi:aminopeptidase [Mycolicibacterium sp. GF69]|uniref:aminopeptidase n=1 Tax=Mycolicibacterium sp. GF69 TaxID=2267251 RepID=UPI000DCE9172|nr:aminopeptidase [Mycolicibacterium sp. GF69]RAV18274.1 aminopeptidase [Mycolicibacterium sp. GF69]